MNEAPMCDSKNCPNRAVGLIEDHYGVSWAVCEAHAKSEGATREGGNPGAPSGIAPAPSRPGEARDGRSPQGRIRRWVCSKIGHKWVWTGGWIEMDCARCGMTDDERRVLLREKGLIP